jgi:hypothetical protein
VSGALCELCGSNAFALAVAFAFAIYYLLTTIYFAIAFAPEQRRLPGPPTKETSVRGTR